MANYPSSPRSHWIGRPPTPLGHESLLTLARKVRAAAADADPTRLEQATRQFSDALDRHLQDEASRLSRIVPAEARMLKKGQDRISTIATGLLGDASRGCPASQRDCRSRAEELVALLSLQARDEHHALDRPAA